jgi:hypothetical protein
MRSSKSGYRPDGSLEFVGHFEERGWKLAGTTVPITYIAWSLWLILSGLVLVVG